MHDPLLDWQMSVDKIKKTRAPRRRGSGGAGGRVAAAATAATAAAAADDDEDDAGAGEAPADVDARYAVGRVSAKLRGLDFQEGEPLSVEGTVEQLLQRATDPVRLSHHYVGWSSWC